MEPSAADAVGGPQATSRWAALRRPIPAVALTVVVLAAGFTSWSVLTREGEARFCHAAQGFTVIDGETVLLQSSGPDPECTTGPDHRPGELVLGTDCKVRDEDGTVTTEVPPTGPDGRC